jgi:hypothetical protein
LSFILPENLAESNKRADALATKLEQSEEARKKAEQMLPPSKIFEKDFMTRKLL